MSAIPLNNTSVLLFPQKAQTLNTDTYQFQIREEIKQCAL